MAALEARSVRFAVDYAGDAPKISDACKNFMAYRVAAHATDGKTSKLEADRLARLEILCARACMRAVNTAAPLSGDAATALAALRASDPKALPSKTFGRQFLRDASVAAAVRAAAAPQAGLDGFDAAFVDAFLATAADDDDDLIWAPDYKQPLARRHEARKQNAVIRLATQEPVELDPVLQAEADVVHKAVVDAANNAREDGASPRAGAARPLPALGRLPMDPPSPPKKDQV